MKDSIIRRGNHFLRLDNVGWVLIDGPWFDYLNNFEHQYTRMMRPEDLGTDIVYCDEYPQMNVYSTVTWEKVRWHPGTTIPRNIHRKAHIWRYLSNRTKYGFRMLPDGKLPGYINGIEYKDEMSHHFLIEYEHTILML